MVKGVVEAVEGPEPDRLRFPKVAGDFEKVGKKSEGGTPKGSKGLNSEQRILNIVNYEGEKGQNENTRESEINNFVSEGSHGRFVAGAETSAGIPVGDGVGEVVGQEDQGYGQDWIAHFDGNKGARDGVRDGEHEGSIAYGI